MLDLSSLGALDGADGWVVGGVMYGTVCARSSGDSNRSFLTRGDSSSSVKSRTTQPLFRDCGMWSGNGTGRDGTATRMADPCGRLLWLGRKDMRGVTGACQ